MAGILNSPPLPQLRKLRRAARDFTDEIYVWGAMRFTNMDKISEMVQAAFSDESAQS